MPVFNDSENLPPRKLVPEGDYAFCVREFSCSISAGGSTGGSDKFELELELEGQDTTVSENLIDHPKCAWKLDTFLKSAGVALAKGQGFEFRKDVADANGARWVNPLGLRGWCRIKVENYTKNNEARQSNKVATFYTDRPKLAPDAKLQASALTDDENKPF